MRILVADDHEMVRDTLASFLSSEERMQVVPAADLDEALKTIEQKGPFDLVLLDFKMPGMNGLQGLSRALDRFPDQAFAILSGSAPAQVAQDAVDMGARGYLPKAMGAKSVVNAVRFMALGETYLPVNLTQHGVDGDDMLSDRLSQRETEVLTGICQGQSNKEIARDLDLQEVTIKLHVRTLCKKLNAKNRTHAVALAKEAGFGA